MNSVDTLTCLAFSPDGQKIASSTAHSGVTITDIALKSKCQLDDAHARTITAIAWSPDSENIMGTSIDHKIHCWNATSLHPLGLPLAGHKDLIITAEFLSVSSQAISLSRDGELLIWNTGNGKITQTETVSNSNGTIFIGALSMDGTLLVTTDGRKGVAWEIPTCMKIAEIELPDTPSLQTAIFPHNDQSSSACIWRRVFLYVGRIHWET
ncbi:WD40-repeat-containing domain protein [Suillus paluster]|uniref:WD40-repeat-containing domain protein n=1 Tax=Suillus paluster TaxID=48578 RepID=UPI001B860F8D|nr:WD40-repeat-containing domain protein [Suillus paluster]KAG1734916.1 WD40-repeat-containing domain protein [Suillus paluster]